VIPKNVNNHLTFNVLHSETVVVFRCIIPTGRLPTTSPISLVSGRSRGWVKMRCARYGLKEVSIAGRLFANGEPKFPNGRETRKSLS